MESDVTAGGRTAVVYSWRRIWRYMYCFPFHCMSSSLLTQSIMLSRPLQTFGGRLKVVSLVSHDKYLVLGQNSGICFLPALQYVSSQAQYEVLVETVGCNT